MYIKQNNIYLSNKYIYLLTLRFPLPLLSLSDRPLLIADESARLPRCVFPPVALVLSFLVAP